MRVLLYAKLLKETKTEETVVFFVTFLSLVAFQLGEARAPCPPPLWLRLCMRFNLHSIRFEVFINRKSILFSIMLD